MSAISWPAASWLVIITFFHNFLVNSVRCLAIHSHLSRTVNIQTFRPTPEILLRIVCRRRNQRHICTGLMVSFLGPYVHLLSEMLQHLMQGMMMVTVVIMMVMVVFFALLLVISAAQSLCEATVVEAASIGVSIFQVVLG